MTDTTAEQAASKPRRRRAAPRAVRRARLMRTTAFKLTIVYLLVFGGLALGLIAYISNTTKDIIDRQLEAAIEGESAELVNEYRRTGLFRLMNTIERRSMRPDANLYLITDFSGNPIAGNVAELIYDPAEARVGEAFPVRYIRLVPAENAERKTHRALARLSVIGGNYRLLVGRDVEDRIEFSAIISRSIRGAMVVVAVLALLSWAFISRVVLRKVDAVGASTRRIVAGDLARRLPTDGSGDEFDRLATSVNRMLDEIERLHAGLQEVSQNIAHDLKTPLTRVRNRLDEMLRLEPEGAEREATLTATIEECDQLIRTFDALLTIARVESHAAAVELEPIDLSAVVGDMGEFYEPAAEDAGMQLVVDVAPGLAIPGEPTLLRTMIANLLDNAMKYGASETNIVELRLQRAGEDAILTVRDHGPGVAERDRARLTDRFVRMDAARSKPGAGLGLSMVKAIVGHHGGTLTLDDAAPGLAVRIALPLASADAR
ncbi:HAMP domain-containing sensor histidine kinase [Acuticoccus sp. I52.16.1]|uniref:HAMP domain-containing sensor histidine kinase n=1 Tax=Acuticoccus sp. I52.16.1 TaxID=2928472 RepID=UPI001FD1DB36|nr:HAMP domain-containing sensor histidine kinase [Acuticoccus sp. I52.16.1]UOM34254.1 HAMP domain-containing histidine kinase [Acuticoccus sp. I52.16.1]